MSDQPSHREANRHGEVKALVTLDFRLSDPANGASDEWWEDVIVSALDLPMDDRDIGIVAVEIVTPEEQP